MGISTVMLRLYSEQRFVNLGDVKAGKYTDAWKLNQQRHRKKIRGRSQKGMISF